MYVGHAKVSQWNCNTLFEEVHSLVHSPLVTPIGQLGAAVQN